MPAFPIQGCKSAHLTAAGSTLISGAAGIYFGLSVNTGASTATVTLYDGIDTSGTVIGVFTAAAAASFLAPMVGRKFSTGLYAVVTGAPDLTVFYS